MSLIACTSDCVYQRDGYCSLERAVSCGIPNETDHCVNFIPKARTDETILSSTPAADDGPLPL